MDEPATPRALRARFVAGGWWWVLAGATKTGRGLIGCGFSAVDLEISSIADRRSPVVETYR